MSKEEVTIQFETASHHLSGGTEQSDDKRRYQYPGLRADIWVRNLPITKQEWGRSPVRAVRSLRDQTYSEISSSCLTAKPQQILGQDTCPRAGTLRSRS
jgi:hypothetical protein